MSKQFDDVATVELGGGVQIPQLGFGTFQIWPYEAQQAVEDALALGYRHIDTAAAYCNEGQVGAALKATGMADRTFVTTKLRNGDQGVDETLRGCEESLGLLGIDAIDLYLIHWPAPTLGRYVDAWKTMVELQRRGLVRAIGVSNFLPEHLERIIEETGVVPVVNQIESHPRFWQPELEAYCAERDIAIEAYSPLGHGKDIESEPVCAAAERLGVTPAQVVLRWHAQKGHIVLPKSTKPARMKQNMDIYGFELTDVEVAAIDALDDPSASVSLDPRSFAAPQTLEDMLARGSVKLEP
ncbi:MAG: aldo/keto reductase [Collinsella intestinalis]|nr:aldo/keto reductase [Collinsella intestinalis]